jgi:N-acetylglucosaminyldiphosphoundecaprenol N-acetyl-beta-D-mannosaminyltransferase
MENRKRIRLGRAVVDVISKKEVLVLSRDFLSSPRAVPAVITTVNAQFVYLAHQQPRFEALLKRSDINVADGMSLVFASHLFKHALPERITGVELTADLCQLAAETGVSAYLLGGNIGSAEAAAAYLETRFLGLRIAGVDCPPLGFENSPELAGAVLARIQDARPALLIVCFGAPKQEYWIEENLSALPVKLAIGVGSTFDILSGQSARAPQWMQRIGMEWFFRLCVDPARLWHRYLVGNSYFIWAVLIQAAGHRFLRKPKLKDQVVL